jgi:hypothetical protein
MQFNELSHEIPLREVTPAGSDWGDQLAPPFVVLKMAAPALVDDDPIAVQIRTLKHEIPLKLAMPEGIVSTFHCVPASVVVITLPALPPPSLTA